MSVSEWYLVGRRGVGGEAEETGLRCWVEEKLRVQAGSACVFPVVIATSGGTHHERQNTWVMWCVLGLLPLSPCIFGIPRAMLSQSSSPCAAASGSESWALAGWLAVVGHQEERDGMKLYRRPPMCLSW